MYERNLDTIFEAGVWLIRRAVEKAIERNMPPEPDFVRADFDDDILQFHAPKPRLRVLPPDAVYLNLSGLGAACLIQGGLRQAQTAQYLAQRQALNAQLNGAGGRW